MGTRGRKSAAELGVIHGNPQRPDAPEELTREQAEEWRAVVERIPVDWFGRETWPFLVQYCRHICNSRFIAGLIEAAQDIDTGDRTALMRYNRLLGLQERQSNALMGLATPAAKRPDQPIEIHAPLCGFSGQARRQRDIIVGSMT